MSMNEGGIRQRWTLIGMAITAIMGVSAVLILTCGSAFVLLFSASGESSPSRAKEWFRTVVGVDPDRFSNIQHYTVQGIDFSHHFRFQYSDRKDLDQIIAKHGLVAKQGRSPVNISGLPEWYDPFSVPNDSPRFSRSGNEPILLIIDLTNKIGYFEFVHI